jgi:ornithine--oxo-acid transaminase
MHDDLHGSSDPSRPFIEREARFGAGNYAPLPVVLASGQGAWATDVGGRRYLDLMSAYSAVSFGHAHPHIVGALIEQARKLAVTSRAFYNDGLPLLLERITNLTGLARALPSNGGAEAVETALKAMRKWGYRVKGIAPDQAEIIACRGNFHGRTITIVGFSSEAQYRDGFGPFPPGFVTIPYGDAQALAAAITPNTAGFLVEPVQGEGGIVVPPDGYLAECARICRERNVLLVCDEIQTGLGRTGYFLGCEHDGVAPDGVILGKALGGGLLPVSLFIATDDVMQVFTPGDHGNTFGGNPLACAVAMAALDVLEREDLVARSAALGRWLLAELRAIESPVIADVRGRGLFIGIEIDPRRATAHDVVLRLLRHGILSKDTHGTVVRIAPPLTIVAADLAWAVGEIAAVCREIEAGPALGSPL